MAYSDTTFSSADRDVSEHWLASGYGRITLGRQFGGFTMHTAGDDRFVIATAQLDGTIECTLNADQFMVIAASAPCAWSDDDGGGDLSAEPALVRPGFTNSARMRQATVAVSLDPRSLRRTARLLYGRDDLEVHFDDGRPADAAAAAHWRALLEFARSNSEAGLLQHDLVRASMYQLLAVSTVESFRLIGDRRELRISAERRQQVFRGGAEFLRAFASLPITLEDIAEAAGATVPELVDAFHSHALREISPTTFLRDLRLKAAMEDLHDADPTSGDTVAAISHRWGFSSPSRFAAYFRAAYGVSPKHVLDR